LRKARNLIKSRPDPRLKSELCLAWSFKEFDIVTPPDIGLKRPKMSPRFASGHSQKWLCHQTSKNRSARRRVTDVHSRASKAASVAPCISRSRLAENGVSACANGKLGLR